MEPFEQHVRKNAVLNSVPSRDLQRLLPHMQKTDIEARQVLYQEGAPVDQVYFPTTTLVSMLMPTAEGGTVELAMVGPEGFVGVGAILNGPKTREHGALAKAITLIPGTVIQLRSDVFQAAVDGNLELARCIRPYLGLLYTELSLSVSCNRLHSLEQRCARWLLTAMDKSAGMTEVPVTQEMLAAILGVYRQSIVQALNELEAKQVIRCGWGAIKVENRQRLSAMACECYYILKKRSDGLTD